MGKVNKLTNGSVFIDGISRMGQIKEVDLPKLKAIMEDQEALGNIGKAEFPAGFDKMECKIVFNGPYEISLVQAFDIYTPVLLTLRSSVDQFGAAGGLIGRVGVIVNMTATFKEAPGMNFQQQKSVDMETSLNVTRYQLIMNGVEIVDLDIVANIYRTGGVDRLIEYRNLLGI